MRFARLLSPVVVAVVGVVIGCAGAEPEIDEENNGGDAGFDIDAVADDVDETSDADGGDAEETGNGDPCELCDDDQICVDEECVDPCIEQGAECGTVDYDGDQFECGDCPGGDCQDGSCPSVCETFDAECGQVYYEGDPYDCGQCDDIGRCMRNNRCTPGEGYVRIVAGRAHTCGSNPAGDLLCWGRNDEGQLGDGNVPDNSTTASPVTDSWTNVSEESTLSTLNHHTCTSLEDDHLYCWGNSGSGRLTGEELDDGGVPVDVGLTGEYVAAGGEHSCAVTSAGKLVCWGRGNLGQLGRGDPIFEPGEPARVVQHPTSGEDLDDVVDVSLGSTHSCAIDRDNDLWCWGRNHQGQLGHGNTTDGPDHAEPVTDIGPVRGLDAGFDHTCAIDVGGQLWCWGDNGDGRLGHGELTDLEDAPVAVDIDESVVDVSAGRSHTCAVGVSGSLYCWGDNEYGQIGQSTAGDYLEEPGVVDDLDDVRRVAAGGRHTCALAGAGDVYCWGRGDDGQLGDGTTTESRSTPVLVE